MKTYLIIAAVILIAAAAGFFLYRRSMKAAASIYYVNHYGQKPQSGRTHPVSNLSDEELEWLLRFYDNEIKTRYHKVAGGMLVESGSSFQIQIERDLKNRRLSDEQIDELTRKLFEMMGRIERYDQERYRKMDDIRQKLKQLKNL